MHSLLKSQYVHKMIVVIKIKKNPKTITVNNKSQLFNVLIYEFIVIRWQPRESHGQSPDENAQQASYSPICRTQPNSQYFQIVFFLFFLVKMWRISNFHTPNKQPKLGHMRKLLGAKKGANTKIFHMCVFVALAFFVVVCSEQRINIHAIEI